MNFDTFRHRQGVAQFEERDVRILADQFLEKRLDQGASFLAQEGAPEARDERDRVSGSTVPTVRLLQLTPSSAWLRHGRSGPLQYTAETASGAHSAKVLTRSILPEQEEHKPCLMRTPPRFIL